MNKSDFITKLAGKIEGMTKKDAGLIIETIGEVITETLVAGDNITIPNVGKFLVKDTNGRNARNPQNGNTIVIPPSKKVVFKATSSLKETIKNI